MLPPSPRGRGRVRLALVSAGAVVCSVIAGLVAPPSQAFDVNYLTDPTGAVACEIVDDDQDSLRCDLIGDVTAPAPTPARPGDCPTDWAPVATMDGGDYDLPRWGACVGDAISGGPRLGVGRTLQVGVFACTGLNAGVSCRNTTTGYGFTLSPSKLRYLRPPARAALSPRGLGPLRIGMTKARAKRTGYITKPGVCGVPNLKASKGREVYLTWTKGRLTGIFARGTTNVQTTRRVGVGSMLSAVRAAYPGRLVLTTNVVDGNAPEYVYLARRGKQQIVFLLSNTGTSPHATTAISGVWVTRGWTAREGLFFDGC